MKILLITYMVLIQFMIPCNYQEMPYSQVFTKDKNFFDVNLIIDKTKVKDYYLGKSALEYEKLINIPIKKGMKYERI